MPIYPGPSSCEESITRVDMTSATIRMRNPNAPDEFRNVGVILLSGPAKAPKGEFPEVLVDVYVGNLGTIFPSASEEQIAELDRVLADTKREALRLSGTRSPQERVLHRIQQSAPRVSIVALSLPLEMLAPSSRSEA